MRKRVALVVMLLLKCSSFIFSAVIPSSSSSPKVVKFFNFPVNDTLKKCCASYFISTFGCNRIDGALVVCTNDIRAHVQDHIATIKRFLFTQVGSCVQEAQLDKLNLIIQEAVNQKRLDIIKVITQYLYTGQGQPVICLLAAKGYTNSCKCLLENGEDVNRPNILGKTPLICAAQNGHTKTVELLLQKNADSNLKTVCNKNAMELAHDNGYDNIALLIVKVKVKQAQKELESIMIE
jgi:hypothetical protein